MKITCPHCGLSGRVSEQKLKASSGSVRCPGCQKTFTPVVKSTPGVDIPPRPSRPSPKVRPSKKEEVLVGARSGDDVPFTRVMDSEATPPDDNIIVEIEGIDIPKQPQETAGEQEIISLSEDDIVSEGGIPSLPVEEMPEGVLGEGLESPIPEKPSLKGLLGFLPRTKKAPPTETVARVSVPGRGAKKGIRGGFFLVFLFVLCLWGGYWFFSTYWPPYAREKELIADSRQLFDKYHELMVFLKVGLPDPVFSTKVAEAAYVWEVYREKHEERYGKDPLFVSLEITGRLFLAVKELLDRDMSPDNFLGLEWGEGFPFVTKEEYVNAVVGGIPLCITSAEKNFQFTKEILDAQSDSNFVSVTLNRILNVDSGSERRGYGVDLIKANKDFMGFTTTMPVLERAVLDVKKMMKPFEKK